MGTEIWTDGDSTSGQQQIWMARDGFVDLVQGGFLPFESHETVGAHVDAALTRGLDGVVTMEDGAVYISPAQALDDLAMNHPAFSKAIEAPWLAAEKEAFSQRHAEAATRRYRLRQTVRVIEFGLPDTGALHLWLPTPLHVPGKQEVRLVSASPAGLTETWFPEAGQFYNAPILIDRCAPLPALTAEFEVTQTAEAIRAHCDEALVWRRRSIPEQTAEALDDWIKRVLQEGPCPGAETVEALLGAIEAEMTISAAPAGAGEPVAQLLSTRSGDVPMLTGLLVMALNRLGYGARAGRAVAFPLREGKARLTFPNGTGYDHSFLDWRHPESGAAGSADLNYLQHRFMGGAASRSRMRNGLYPGDLILAGRPQQSHIRFLHPRQSHALPAPVRSEFEIEWLSREATQR